MHVMGYREDGGGWEPFSRAGTSVEAYTALEKRHTQPPDDLTFLG